MYAIELDNVCKSFGPVRAVDGLSIQVPQGCVYGFLGPNGAGKTTTLRMIMDIIRPDSGSIRLFGDPASSPARDRVGYMPEERGLYRKMTVTAVLNYFGSLKGMPAGRLQHRRCPHGSSGSIWPSMPARRSRSFRGECTRSSSSS